MKQLQRLARWGIWIEVGCFVLAALPFVSVRIADLPWPWNDLGFVLLAILAWRAVVTVRRVEKALATSK